MKKYAKESPAGFAESKSESLSLSPVATIPSIGNPIAEIKNPIVTGVRFAPAL